MWNDPKRAQELGKEKKALEGVVLVVSQLDSDISDNTELYEMSKDDNDVAGLTTIEAEVAKIETIVAGLEFRRMFNQAADPSFCFHSASLSGLGQAS